MNHISNVEVHLKTRSGNVKLILKHERSFKILYVLLTISDRSEIDHAVFKAQVNFSTPQNSNRHKRYKNSSMLEETRYVLYKFYKPFNQALTSLLKDSKFDYGAY